MNARYVGVGVARYDNSPPYERLMRAAGHARSLGDHLANLGFTTKLFESPTNAEVQAELRSFLADASVVVIYWTGHGVAPDQRDLRLITRNTSVEARLAETCQPAMLIEDALVAGATQVLIILDTCYSGAAVVDAVEVAAQFDVRSGVDGDRWVGVTASCQSYARAVDGRFAEALLTLLRNGPSTSDHRTRWNMYNEGLTGPELLEALQAEWPHDFQRPGLATHGWARPIMRNPWHDRDLAYQLVEHLVHSARGAAPGERGWYFTGRRRILSQIIEWMHTGRPGLHVVTGAAGSGKSAVVGRIATLADPKVRADLLADMPLGPDDPDPGEGAVDAVLYARGQSHDTMLTLLSQKLGTPGAVSIHGVLESLVRTNRCPTVIVDALDEAQSADLPRLVTELLVPLASKAQVLVGTRAHTITDETTLLDLFADDAVVLDLAGEADTREDVREYVTRRLAGSANTDIAEIAAMVTQRAISDRGDGGFLYARMVTSRLRDEPVDTAVVGWTDALDDSVMAAFRTDLRRLPADTQRTAQDLLTALAWSYGKGLPAREVWPALASALRPDTRYTVADIDSVLDALRQYIVECGESGQVVYQLFHQELVVQLCEVSAQGLLIDTAVEGLLATQPADSPDPYLRRYGRAHRLRGSGTRVDVARAGADPLALAAALSAHSRVLTDDGRRDEALTATQEAVDLYRAHAPRPDRAVALNDLANRLADLGRNEDALAAAREATGVYRALAGADAAQLPALAGALTNLATRLADLGQREEALTLTEEAVAVYRASAEADSAHRPALAIALNNLAVRLAEHGRRAEALAVAEEVVALRYALQPPDATALALALNNLALRRADVGQHVEALSAAEEAVALRRQLAQRNTAAHLPALAVSLNTLANRLGDLGRHAEALAAAAEAVTLHRALAESTPEAYLPDLATSLTALTNRLADVGRQNDALTGADEVVTIYRGLAAGNPAHGPNLAGSLSNLALRLGVTGRMDAAVTTAEEAVALYRPLAEARPATYGAALAAASATLATAATARLSTVQSGLCLPAGRSKEPV